MTCVLCQGTSKLFYLLTKHAVMCILAFSVKKKIRQDRSGITLGGTTLELHYLGLNHSDSTLVMRLPKEKIVFIVDTIPVGSVPGRGFIDIYPLETEEGNG